MKYTDQEKGRIAIDLLDWMLNSTETHCFMCTNDGVQYWWEDFNEEMVNGKNPRYNSDQIFELYLKERTK